MIKIEKEISLTGEELANEFWELDCSEQSKFFNCIGNIVEKAQGRGIMQIDYIFEEPINNNAVELIKLLYSRGTNLW